MANAESDGFRESRAIHDGAETESNEGAANLTRSQVTPSAVLGLAAGAVEVLVALAPHGRASQRVLRDNQKATSFPAG
jgi:hypothetical protein